MTKGSKRETKTFEFHVSAVAGEAGGDQIRIGGIYAAPDLADAVAQCIRHRFKFADGAPLTLLHLDKLEARRVKP